MMGSLASLLERWMVALVNRHRPVRKPRAVSSGGFEVGMSVPLTPTSPPSEIVTLSSELRGKPNYLVGKSGGGKTNTQVQLIDWEIHEGRTVVVLDLRGDLIERILRRCLGSHVPVERMVLIDLADSEYVTPLNLFAGCGGLPYQRALPALEFIRARSSGLGVQTEETMRCGFTALAETGSSLLDFDRLLSDDCFRSTLLSRVSDPYTLSFFDRFASLSPEKRLGWILPCMNKLAPFLSVPIARRMLGTLDCIDLAGILNRPGQVVLISLSVDRHHEAALLIGSLLVSGFERVVLGRIEQKESDRVPVRLFLDEFENFTAGIAFESIIQEGRRFGLGTTVSHQNQAQLDSKTRHLIRNNAAVQILFGQGPLDAAELASEITTMSRDEARIALLGLSPGDAFVMRTGVPPVKVRTRLSKDPSVSDADLAKYRRGAIARYGRLVTDIDAEIAARMRPKDAKSHATLKEVRHDRLPKI